MKTVMKSFGQAVLVLRYRFSCAVFIAYWTTSHLSAGDLWLIRAMRSAKLIAVAILLCALFQPAAFAITINMSYSNEGDPVPHDENPSWDPTGSILKAHFQVAKQIWENLLPGPGEYDFDFEWDDDLSPLTNGQWTPSVGIIDDFIEINPNRSWFVDSTPSDNDEFGVPTQTLYSGISPPELKSSHFPATAPPDALEVGYRANGVSMVNGVGGFNSTNGIDLLSTIVHEMGHALGLSGIEPGNYNILPQHIGGIANVEVLEGGGGHLAGQGNVPYLMCENCGAAGVRRSPTATDVLVIAEDQGITNVHLARVGRISAGNWNNTNAWIGADVPDSTQIAYVRTAAAVTLDVNASVKSLVVDSSGSVDAAGFQLTSASDIRFDGGAISVAANGVVTAEAIHGDPATLTTAAGSTIQFNNFTRGASSATAATFNGNVKIGVGAKDDPPVTFNPDTITAWNVGQNLAVGNGQRRTTLVIDNGAWTVGGALDIAGEVLVDAGTFLGGSSFSGGSLSVTGPVTVAAMTYRGSEASNTTYGISGGRAVRFVDPPNPTIMKIFSGAEMTFEDTSSGIPIGGRANSGTFNLGGGAGDGGPGAKLTFKGHSDAQSSHIVNFGGLKGDALSGTRAGNGGETRFEGNSAAGGANIRNDAVVDDQGGRGGRTVFADSSSAGAAIINNYGTTTYASRENGSTEFRTNPAGGAAYATITNHPTSAYQAPDNATAPRTTFYGTSTAGNATITNKGAVTGFFYGGRTFFRENSTAGDATLISEGGGNGGSGYVGATIFYDTSKAGTAELRAKTGGGRFEFHDNSSAEDASFIIETSPGVISGQIGFSNYSKAGTADFTIEPNGYIPLIHFVDNASAEQAVFNLMDNSASKLLFQGSSKADRATIDVGSTAVVQFNSNSQIGDATIRIHRGGGMQVGGASVTAGTATIDVEGTLFYNGTRGALSFGGVANGAGSATITIQGGNAVSAQGGLVQFSYSASGENATIIVESGKAPGALGGELYFGSGANGANARIVNQQGGFVDVSGNRNWLAKTTFGSYEGAGSIYLGGVELEMGSRNTDAAISGAITDSASLGGKLTKVGAGTLTLSGVNTYTGLTTVNAGAVVVNGSNVGGAEVNSGGTLKGSGSLGGTVTVKAGGTFAPGVSPGKITVGGLSLLSESTLVMELGGIAAGTQYDQVISSGAFSLAGALNVSLINGFSPSAGQSFNLFDWGTVSGTFSTLSLPTLGSTLGWNTSQLYTSGVLSITSADYNQNGTVDAADYVVWRKNGGSAQDYNIWRANFGQTAGGGTGVGSTAAVPEPATPLLLALAAFLTPWPSRQRPRSKNSSDPFSKPGHGNHGIIIGAKFVKEQR